MARKGFCRLLLVLLTPAHCLAATEVTWLTYDSPPLSISKGAMAGDGFADQQVRFLSGLLTGMQNKVLEASLPRVWHEMESRDGVCTVMALPSPERRQVASFSHRPVVAPSYRLLVAAGRQAAVAPFVTDDGFIDLDRIPLDAAIRGGLIAGRRYPGSIQSFVHDRQRAGMLEELPTSQQLFSLLQAGRLDFAFVQALEVPYYGLTFPPLQQWRTYPVKGSPADFKAYVACSNRPLGHLVIEKIDRLLDDPTNWAGYIEPLRRWVEPADFAAALAAPPEPDASP